MTFREKVTDTIRKYGLIEENDGVKGILAGLSGGADSVALFRVLNEIKDEFGLKLACAHINHNIRSGAAERDQSFCEKLCSEYGIELYTLSENVPDYAKKNGLSVEEAGRIVRYNFFEATLAALPRYSWKIATAHTKDDNAETVLLGLLKGTSHIAISPKRGNIIRPLITVTKDEIYEYLQEIGQNFNYDETNSDMKYLRNKIRLKLIPYLKEEFNCNYTNTVYNISDILEKESEFLDIGVTDFIEKHCKFGENGKVSAEVEISDLRKLHIAQFRRFIKKIYYKISGETAELSYTNIADVITLVKKGQTGKRVQLPRGVIAAVSYGWLFLIKSEKCPVVFPAVLTVKQNETVSVNGYTLKLTGNPDETGYKYRYTASGNELIIRTRRDGDKVFLKGVNGHKKVSDIFTDKKIPRDTRAKIPVITENGEIIIIPGLYEKEITGNSYLYIFC
jgi:tRNA(Ile)-lysidine synthase